MDTSKVKNNNYFGTVGSIYNFRLLLIRLSADNVVTSKVKNRGANSKPNLETRWGGSRSTASRMTIGNFFMGE